MVLNRIAKPGPLVPVINDLFQLAHGIPHAKDRSRTFNLCYELFKQQKNCRDAEKIGALRQRAEMIRNSIKEKYPGVELQSKVPPT
jgi:hypothetical protein